MSRELSEELASVCNAADRGEKVTAIHLFGVRNAEKLRNLSLSELNQIASDAGQSPKYGTELRKMVRLSKYVQVK